MKALFDKLSAPLEWIAGQIAARPKAALMVWIVSLAVVAWAL